MIESTIYVGDLRSHIGSHRNIHITVPGETFFSATAHIVDDIICDFTLESVSHGIVVHGTMQANYGAKCSYGLVDLVEDLSVHVNELFEEQTHHRKAPTDDEDEIYSYSGDEIDLEELIRDSILLSLPIAPVCSHGPENCSICSSQIAPFINDVDPNFVDNVVGGEQDATGTNKVDDRWAALDELKFDD